MDNPRLRLLIGSKGALVLEPVRFHGRPLPVELRCAVVDEIAPGLWHWTARHPSIRENVSSYYLLPERVLIDPILPPEGLEWFAEREDPTDVLLTNRHHDRDAWRMRAA